MSVDLFRRHVESLRARFDIIGLDEVAESPAPDRLAITFDDGYRGVFEHAFPVLREWGIPATVFLVTGRVGSADLLWWDRLLVGVERLRALPPSQQESRLRGIGPSWGQLLARAPLEHLLDAYKATTGSERDAVDGLLGQAGSGPHTAPDRIFLSEKEIAELRNAGWTFGAHTVSHPLLPWLDDRRLQDELVASRDAVLQLTGQRGCWFSYPDGVFSDREETEVRRAGFDGAVQTGRRPARHGRFALPRVGISPWAIASPDGEYSAWRARWALGRLTGRRMLGLLKGPRND
jgi:peptidoglycan/xylan/chitin deacetylase (PgdA/CDA1 family)